MKKILKTLGIIILTLLLLLLSAYFYLRFMPEKSVTNKPADYKMSVSKFATEYESNPSGCDSKYIDRIIELKGVISEISTDQNGSIVFVLHDKQSQAGVLCTLNKNEKRAASHYKKGDTLTIKGTCTGMLFEVVLNKCIIVE